MKKNIFNPEQFKELNIEKRAFLDAYLKRFSSMQDFLGAKIFPLILDIAGIGYGKMSEVLFNFYLILKGRELLIR